MMQVVHRKSHFTPASVCVEWEDVIHKISDGFKTDTCILIDEGRLYKGSPTFVCRNNFYPGSIKKAFDSVKEYDNLHIYVSFSETSNCFGSHCDDVDVLIVQSVGEVSYEFENSQIIRVKPGHSLFIPAGVYHKPIVHGPRITLSFNK